MRVSVSPACTPEVRGLGYQGVWCRQPKKQPAVGHSPDHTGHREHAVARRRLPNVGEEGDIRRSAISKPAVTPCQEKVGSILQISSVKAWEVCRRGRGLDLDSGNGAQPRNKEAPPPCPTGANGSCLPVSVNINFYHLVWRLIGAWPPSPHSHTNKKNPKKHLK